MSRRPAIVTAYEVELILKGAKKAGVSVKIVAKPGQVEFIPIDEKNSAALTPTIEEWKAARDARKKAQADGRPRR